jgi:shikimate kinase
LRPQKVIFLVGFMGAGKSSVGKLLSVLLGLDFIDSDSFIEKNEGMSIDTIVSKYSWDYFREREAEWLDKLHPNNSIVCATGGGLPYFHDNMEKMLQLGTVIYLECSNEVLFERISNQNANRPLLSALSGDELKDFITTTMAERASYYSRANIIINGNENVEAIAKQLVKILA